MCRQIAGLGRVEQGATWLHGLDGNPVYEAALAAGLMTGLERRVAGGDPVPVLLPCMHRVPSSGEPWLDCPGAPSCWAHPCALPNAC